MDRRPYNSLKEIKLELQTLNLERKIQMEELKLTKHQIKEDLRPINWIATLLKGVKKYGALILLKKMLR
ncbi:hypothetical protein HZY62_00525 [Maribacter polysiphoniae]|uniref:Glutaminyl-tRNA synthetase n=1 Tax=Maribacter polysiphoniae TaxID=429344 RepID=A0A316E2I9_9FLAO|nr:DUF6327 family protein [Maribacter polysiphoniae]MBD1259056.1 hypothetical protein [Maribacter polysiphoniae]PWK24611.1 hypothetical protein LX92_00975 [Maribacter polysiphoniae]